MEVLYRLSFSVIMRNATLQLRFVSMATSLFLLWVISTCVHTSRGGVADARRDIEPRTQVKGTSGALTSIEAIAMKTFNVRTNLVKSEHARRVPTLENKTEKVQAGAMATYLERSMIDHLDYAEARTHPPTEP